MEMDCRVLNGDPTTIEFKKDWADKYEVSGYFHKPDWYTTLAEAEQRQIEMAFARLKTLEKEKEKLLKIVAGYK